VEALEALLEFRRKGKIHWAITIFASIIIKKS